MSKPPKATPAKKKSFEISLTEKLSYGRGGDPSNKQKCLTVDFEGKALPIYSLDISINLGSAKNGMKVTRQAQIATNGFLLDRPSVVEKHRQTTLDLVQPKNREEVDADRHMGDGVICMDVTKRNDLATLLLRLGFDEEQTKQVVRKVDELSGVGKKKGNKSTGNKITPASIRAAQEANGEEPYL